MREGLLRRKPGEALSHLQNKYINIFDKDRKMIEFFHEPCYTGTTFRPNHRIGEEGFMDKKHSKRSAFSGKIGFVLSAAGASVGLGNICAFCLGPFIQFFNGLVSERVLQYKPEKA